MAASISLNVAQLRSAIQDEYADVAACPTKDFHFHTGRRLTRLLGYDPASIDPLPDAAVESFAGVGNPFAAGRLQPGEIVVEVGSGAGLDAILAAQQVGPGGRVTGVDMTEAMLRKARANAALLGIDNAEFRHGYAEALPVTDASADVVISNGVINLCPDKGVVYREIFRVLRSGGRIQVADIAVQQAVPEEAKADVALWTGWIAGALLEAEMRELLAAAGFVAVEIAAPRWDAFDGAPSDSSAAAFGTHGLVITGRKPSEAGRVAP